MTSKEKAYAVIEWAELQGVEIKYKDESLFMKALGLLLSFNKTFMTSFTTTIGSTIYFPSRKWLAERNPETTIAIVAHEVTVGQQWPDATGAERLRYQHGRSRMVGPPIQLAACMGGEAVFGTQLLLHVPGYRKGEQFRGHLDCPDQR